MQPNGREGSDGSAQRGRSLISTITLLWPPYGIGHYIFGPVVSIFLFFYLFSSPNLSRRRLDVYHTSTHDVALVRISNHV